jgi:ATP-dependent DNA helicase RecG
VTVTPDKLEILSFPGPDRSISDENIKALHMVATRYRNRRIGEFLKELRLVEGRNTGVPLK